MKKIPRTKLKLATDTIRVLTDMRAVAGGIIVPTRASGDGCATSCDRCVSDFASDCTSC